MDAQIIEGTFADIRRQILDLPLEPDDRLRVIVTTAEPKTDINDPLILNALRRNGLILVPTHHTSQKVTTELVNELSEG